MAVVAEAVLVVQEMVPMEESEQVCFPHGVLQPGLVKT
jgi:hypothetical protein